MFAVKNVVAKGFTEENRAYICAYMLSDELKSGDLLDGNGALRYSSAEMRDKLSGRIPYYMIPTYYTVLDRFPVNANGKIAKKELAAPRTDSNADSYIAPANETEKYFCELFASCLHREKVGAGDDFYVIGGDSISAIEMVSLCNLCEISIGDIYKYRTPQKLAEFYRTQYADSGCDGNKAERNKAALSGMKKSFPKMLRQIRIWSLRFWTMTVLRSSSAR